MRFKHIFVIASLWIASHVSGSAAFAQAGAGHGGFGVQCNGGEVYPIDVFDFKTKRHIDLEEVPTRESLLKLVKKRVSDRTLKGQIVERLNSLGSFESWPLDPKQPGSSDIFTDSMLPSGCKLIQLAVFRGSELRRKYEGRLNEDAKRIIELHEAIYAVGRDLYSHTNPILTRVLARTIVSKDVNSQVMHDLILLFTKSAPYISELSALTEKRVREWSGTDPVDHERAVTSKYWDWVQSKLKTLFSTFGTDPMNRFTDFQYIPRRRIYIYRATYFMHPQGVDKEAPAKICPAIVAEDFDFMGGSQYTLMMRDRVDFSRYTPLQYPEFGLTGTKVVPMSIFDTHPLREVDWGPKYGKHLVNDNTMLPVLEVKNQDGDIALNYAIFHRDEIRSWDYGKVNYYFEDRDLVLLPSLMGKQIAFESIAENRDFQCTYDRWNYLDEGGNFRDALEFVTQHQEIWSDFDFKSDLMPALLKASPYQKH